MNADALLERREKQRVPLRAHVCFGGGKNFFTGTISDISEGGVKIQLVDSSSLPSDEMEITIEPESGNYMELQTFEAKGRLAWTSARDGTAGIEFTWIEPQVLDSIRHLVRLERTGFTSWNIRVNGS